jgi:outer membrane protein assembly factor BamB
VPLHAEGAMKALACVLALSACIPFEHDPLIRARTAIREQRFSDAQRELESIPPTKPQFQTAQVLLGTLLLATGQERAALVKIIAARALAPDRFDEDAQFRKVLAALTGQLGTQWTVKTAQPPSALVMTETVRLAISTRGLLTAFDPKRGVMWEHALGARTGAAIAGNLVIVVEQDHARAKLIALDARTGEPSWSRDLGRATSNQNPIIAADSVYVGAAADGQRGTWQAFRVDSGAPLWTAKLDHPPEVSATVDGKLCGIVASSVACVDLRSGATVWHYDGMDHAPSGMAIIAGAGARLYVTSNGTLYGFEIGKPGLAWKLRLDSATTSAPVLSDDGSLVIETADAIVAVDAETGARRWIAHHDPVNPPALAGKPLLRFAGLWVGWSNDGVFAIDDNHKLVFQATVGSVAAPPIMGGANELVIGIGGQHEGVIGLAVEPWGRPAVADR